MSKKGKDPAFLFYPKDWLEGTADLSAEEKGVYIDLLALHHQRKALPNNVSKLARMARMSLSDFEVVWFALSEKFIPEGDFLYNKKLRAEMERRAELSHINSIKGYFSGLLRKHNLEHSLWLDIKKDFHNEDFIDISPETLSEEITDWFLDYCEKWYNQTPAKRQLKMNRS